MLVNLGTLGGLLGGTGKAKMVWESLRAGRDPWTDPAITEKARGILARDFRRFPQLSASTDSDASGTVKLLVNLEDGMEVEAVVIPNDGRPTAASPVPPRTTLCVSSQVGCNRGCIFCATGRMGFIRQLSAFEILAQARRQRPMHQHHGRLRRAAPPLCVDASC